MFEGIVSDLLNRVLGTYIENLDCSKLKISIWGGDVELKNLVIKQSALDELQLPVRPIYGYLKNLCLKIPWSKLYTDQWVANIDGLVLVVVPNSSIVYDAQKEEQLLYETKISTLARIEEAKQRSKIQSLGKESIAQDGFIEKLVAQVIRNIQVQISNIHIRYEDSITCSSKPFAAGFVLQNLSLQSTDAKWGVGLDTAKLIYKLLTCEGFMVYWSPDSKLLCQGVLDSNAIEETLSNLITQKSLEYLLKPVLGPLCLTARLQLNPRPEVDSEPFLTPKADLQVDLQTIEINLSRYQYETMMNLLDSIDAMQVAAAYRKFRPAVTSVKGNAAHWWKYAYDCKIDAIRRSRRNWSWDHICAHRQRGHRYKALYKRKLEGTNWSAEQKAELETLEREMDVFNITLNRKQAEMEQEREGLQKAEEQQKKGWFGGWLSWGSQESTTSAPQEGSLNIVRQFQAEMTTDEKRRMFEAIGYSEEGVPSEMPDSFVDLRLHLLLHQLQLRVIDERLKGAAVCVASVTELVCSADTRSGVGAISVHTLMQRFEVRGMGDTSAPMKVLPENVSVDDPSLLPLLVESLQVSVDVPLLDASFETKPLDAKCDNRVRVVAQPLNIVYHASTIAKLADLFAPPKHVSLQQLHAAALTQFEVVKERSVAGLQVAIEKHSSLDLSVSVSASRLILPQGGVFSPTSNLIVVNLGSVTVASDLCPLLHSPPEKHGDDAAQWTKANAHALLQKMRSSSYDSFNVSITDIQVVVCSSGEDWLGALRSEESTPMHLLRPLGLRVNLYKCLVTSDPNMPRLRVDATLPEIALSILDKRLLMAAVIANSCLINDDTTPLVEESIDTIKEEIDLNQNVIGDEVALVRLETSGLASGLSSTGAPSTPTPQFTDCEVDFTISSMIVEMLKSTSDDDASPPVAVLRLTASRMQLKIVQKTFDLNVNLALSEISADHLEWGSQPIIRTNPEGDSSNSTLFTVKLIQVNPKSPDLHSVHNSITLSVETEISRVAVRLELSALLSALAFVTNLQDGINTAAPATRQRSRKSSRIRRSSMRMSFRGSKHSSRASLHVPKKSPPKIKVQQKFSAKLDQVEAFVSRKNVDIIALYVKGLYADVVMEGAECEMLSHLDQFSLLDPDPRALHSKIVSMEGGRVWSARLRFSTGGDADATFFDVNKFDADLQLQVGTPKIVFLNKTIADIMSWVDHFQAAKEAVVNASQAAARAAKDNLTEAYSHATKVKLDLELKAPVVFVPHDSTSSEGIVFDFGKVLIRNEVSFGAEKNQLGQPSLVDKICLQVQNIKILRRHSAASGHGERFLLSPFCLTVNVIRNLSASWLKTQPEIQMDAVLPALEIQLGEDDVSSVRSILQGNLGETSPTAQEKAAQEMDLEVFKQRRKKGTL